MGGEGEGEEEEAEGQGMGLGWRKGIEEEVLSQDGAPFDQRYKARACPGFLRLLLGIESVCGETHAILSSRGAKIGGPGSRHPPAQPCLAILPSLLYPPRRRRRVDPRRR